MTFRCKNFLCVVTTIALTAALLRPSTNAFAQEAAATPLSKVERKNKAPVAKTQLQVTIPKPFETKLKNGLTVMILEDHRFPAVSAELRLRGAGALFEPPDAPGLAGITAEMLREGTKTRTSEQIAEELDRLGAGLSASSSFGSPDVVLGASGLSVNFDAWFALLHDVLLHPTFPAHELARKKQRIKVQLRQQRSSPGFLAEERFSRAVFGSHPAAIVAPTIEAVEALTSEALAAWHRERYSPRNSILAIAGDVRPAELVPKLERWLADWQSAEVKEARPPNPAPASARKIYLVDRPDSVQTTVILGNIAIDRRSEDYIPMVVLNHVLGGGPAARLFLNLREEKGYTYGVYSSFSAVEYPGPWRAGGNMRTEVTEGALKEFFSEIRRMREEKVADGSLEEAKRSVVASFALSLERPARVLSFALTRKIYNLPDDYWDTYPAKIMAVSADEVQRVARKYYNLENLQLVAVGDSRKIKPALEKYGAVEVYDGAGAPVAVPPP
ncbi:MAG: M16 family metallopeptidase [Candidatus Binatia bacterium]